MRNISKPAILPAILFTVAGAEVLVDLSNPGKTGLYDVVR